MKVIVIKNLYFKLRVVNKFIGYNKTLTLDVGDFSLNLKNARVKI